MSFPHPAYPMYGNSPHSLKSLGYVGTLVDEMTLVSILRNAPYGKYIVMPGSEMGEYSAYWRVPDSYNASSLFVECNEPGVKIVSYRMYKPAVTDFIDFLAAVPEILTGYIDRRYNASSRVFDSYSPLNVPVKRHVASSNRFNKIEYPSTRTNSNKSMNDSEVIKYSPKPKQRNTNRPYDTFGNRRSRF